MVQTIKTGMVDTEDVVGDERVVDMSDRIVKLQQDGKQFVTMLNQLSKEKAVREVINWLEEQYRQRVTGLTASATSAATNFAVTTGEGNTVVAVNDVVRVMETGEALLVTAVAADAFTATRSWGGTAAASATSAAKLMVIGNAFPQGASSGTPRYVQRVKGYNYVQDFRHSIFFSDFEEAIELYGGREPGKELVREADNHLRSVESALFFGARDIDTSASPGPRGGMGGAIEFISSNVTDTNGQLTPAEMDTFLQTPLSYATDPVLFVAPTVATVLSQMYRGIWQPPQGGLVKYGVKVNGLVNSTYGTEIPIIVKKEWIDLDAGDGNYGTFAFLIDMDTVRLRPLRDHTVGELRRKIQEPSITGSVYEYRSAVSLQFGQEARHAVLKDVRSYSAS